MTAPPPPSPPGWYPDPNGGTKLRYFDGLRWTDQTLANEPIMASEEPDLSTAEVATDSSGRKPSLRSSWILLGVILAGFSAFLAVLFFVDSSDRVMVSQAHSEEPRVENFYRELQDRGFGTMRRNDAIRWADKSCSGTTPDLWGEKDIYGDGYWPWDSFSFSLIASRYCDG